LPAIRVAELGLKKFSIVTSGTWIRMSVLAQRSIWMTSAFSGPMQLAVASAKFLFRLFFCRDTKVRFYVIGKMSQDVLSG
jgi:hypothetical protein